jgi:hypothetical protein
MVFVLAWSYSVRSTIATANTIDITAVW